MSVSWLGTGRGNGREGARLACCWMWVFDIQQGGVGDIEGIVLGGCFPYVYFYLFILHMAGRRGETLLNGR